MKKSYGFFMIIAVLVAALIGVFFMISHIDPPKKNVVKIGLCLYRFDDTFISNVRHEIEEYVKVYENENDIKINLEVVDAKDNQNTQNHQVERFVSLDYDVLLINVVDRFAASNMIETAVGADIPIIFFNRKPVDDDLNRADNIYYIGAGPKAAGIEQANIIIDAYKESPHSIDIDGDGVINYVLLEGEPSHQDSLVRTEWVIKTLQDNDIPINKLNGAIGNWERAQGSALMEEWLKEYNNIDLIISNNDDMALGAIDAIERANNISGIKAVGIDGTKEALEAIKEGKLLGTIESDKKEYAKAVVEIAMSSIGKSTLPEDIKYKLLDNRTYDVEQIPRIK
ncbi:galactose ABC transporter substrate-binding protein [Lachnoanaerobaculum umeaense]|uniref:D-galactose/methyl-galactoside binding periplasmic protein MglB n=1 Tax=Lachnoanaerobaculum umeaense TaxID=617123 RepID=A0A385PX74_9FIRM|nr:galactose ABC transporter substrate-binding protein [Lachnoanaerobaculum umeaense]AYA98576.1 galactose ABC transporter substrate-binding protein [Lachnoanaerobaculum umeaense]PZW97844.1 methyl-galactoside transport system substrate-binding protein [Lachnoanaerobaculum umeaense]